MPYSQKPLIELFKAGKVPKETTKPKHIETVISNVFIFDEKVYKFYKNDSDFFNKGFRDISEKSVRFSFTRQDFKWNNMLNPSIYLKLVGIKAGDGSIIFSLNDDDADEIAIVMEKVNDSDILFEKLMAGKISQSDSFSIGEQFAEDLKKVQKKLPEKYNYYEIFSSLIADVREWIKSVSEYISIEESGKYCDYLDYFRRKNQQWFEGELSSEIAAIGDVHSHNAVFSDKTLYLMDTFPPKEAWFIGHKLLPLYRIGIDIWVLTGNKGLFESFLKGFENKSGIKIDRRLDPVNTVYASAIMVSYLYMLQRTDASKKEAAEKFHRFIQEYFATLDK